MNKAKIEIRSNPINLIGIEAGHHLYILFTDSKGTQFVISAGPKTRPFNTKSLLENLTIKYEKYDSKHPDWDKNALSKDLKHPNSVIFEGSDSDADVIFAKMKFVADKINAGNYDYKLPIMLWLARVIGINAKDGGIAHCHNSNTVVRILVEEAGLKMILPKDKDGNDVIVPCMDAELVDTALDKMMKGDDLTQAEIEELVFAIAVSAGTALGSWSTFIAGRSAVNKARSYYKAKKAYEEDAKKGGKAKKDDGKNGDGRGEDDNDGGNGDDNNGDDGDDGFGGGFIGGIGGAKVAEKAKIRADKAELKVAA